MEKSDEETQNLGTIILSKTIVDCEPLLQGTINMDGRSITSNHVTYDSVESWIRSISYYGDLMDKS